MVHLCLRRPFREVVYTGFKPTSCGVHALSEMGAKEKKQLGTYYT